MHEELGWPVLFRDITLGCDYDLTKRANQHKIFNWLRQGFLKAGHLGTPCNSFSRARDMPGGPPALLRSDSRPLGLEGLRQADALKVKLGNALTYFSCHVLALALTLHVAFTLENPLRSRLWLCPSVQRLLPRRFTCVVGVTFCSFGTSRKKPTRLLGIDIDLTVLSGHYYRGTKRGMCLFSDKPHVALMSRTNGVWRTKLAEPYPNKSCRALPNVLQILTCP